MKFVDTDPFPFGRVLSLHKLVDTWREIGDCEENVPLRQLARDLVTRAESTATLTSGVDSADDLTPHAQLIDQLMAIAVPPIHAEDWIVCGMAPFTLESFYATPLFMSLVETAIRQSGSIMEGFDDAEGMQTTKVLDAYHIILKMYYGEDTGFRMPTIFKSRVDGLNHYYRVLVDPRFVDIDIVGEKPTLTREQINTLTSNPLDLDLWMSTLPPDRFVFRGFTLVTLLDVTEHEVHSRLKNDLLQKDALTTPRRLDSIETQLRDLLRIKDLRIGVMGLASQRFEDFDRSRTIGRSLLMTDEGVPHCDMKNESSYAELFEKGEPVVLSDLETCTFCTGLEHRIREQEFRGLLLAPLKDGDRIIGVLELATPEPGRLTAFSAVQLMEVIALFSAAMMRSMDERHDKLQALIKEEFTSIHPAVEWRFRRAAEKIEAQRLAGGTKVESEDIVFEGVFPLYGLSDIRDSSIQRNHAIQDDLIEQLGLALSVIVEASSHQPLPALDELGFRIGRYAESLDAGLTSDVEIGALEFLRNDVEPLFDRLEGIHPAVKTKVDEYREAIDPRLGVLYSRRRAYEESVAEVNEVISQFLQRQQGSAQSMYPHYFEKFETDGVDYNIYVGDSIVEDKPFDPLYLRNLRLWQLQTMCGVVWELDGVHDRLKMPLELAHLILVQDFPIAIRFSKDEKRFGVDGAYNARYMIVKKRIDKAVVKGTSERITQPGYIAIVYSQEKERREYRRYLDYLSAAGYIDGPIEDLEVEQLQGVNGLRVLRVKVSPAPPEMEVRTRPELALQRMTVQTNNGDREHPAGT